jgi:transcriptional regulator with XRE-family HTH domain
MLRGPRVKKRISLLGDFITSERVKRGLTQRQLAECSGLNASTISSIELGNLANPAWHIVEQLADALDMKTKNLMRLLPERKAVQMSNDDGERITWLQVRMSEDEKALLSDLAGEYGVSISALVRMMIVHVYEKRPSFVVRSVIAPRGKGFALASMSA